MKTLYFDHFTWLLLGAWLTFTAHLHAASSIQFGKSSYTVAESEGAVPLTVQRTGDTNTEVGVDYASADGTATNGLRYSAVSGTLAFGVGETNKTIVVPILNNGFVEAAQNFRITLDNPTGGAVLGPRATATVFITDNDFGIQFEFVASSASEGDEMALLGVVRGDDGVLPVTVSYFTTDQTAKSGLDYRGITNTLSFAHQERRKLISVPILNNTQKQANRTFRVTLANPVGASLGRETASTVTIVDNDQGFQFGAASYSVAEDAGVATIDVLRGTDDTNSTVTVDFATSDASAANGLDYTGTTKTLIFAPGETVKLVTVPILNDGVKEPKETFRVTLSNPGGGAVLGSPTTAIVTIVDNDSGVSFDLSNYSVVETAEAVVLTVLRGNDAFLGPITVDYATGDAAATAGHDYEAVSGTLLFEENETIKTITVRVLPNPSVSTNTSFNLTLSHPTGGAELGRAVTTVTILKAAQLGTYWTVAPRFDAALTIRREGALNILAWNGDAKLQKADRPTGPWQALTASSPCSVQSGVAATFYQVTSPRPVKVYLPSTYDGQTALPLVILLHGHGGSSGGAASEESYLHLRPLAEARGFLYGLPNGTVDKANDQFWNATDGCCDFFNSDTDDAGYLRTVIEEISRQFAVDPKRVYLVGHSNGAFMAYRMACQSPDLIAGIACLAGVTFLDPSRCTPSQPVNILHIHGTADLGVFYAGGANTTSVPAFLPGNMPAFPGALKTVQFWAGYNGARDPVTDSAPSLDLDSSLPGLDTVITRYTNHPPGGAVELWTINGGNHYPTLSPEFASRVIDWLLGHPKP